MNHRIVLLQIFLFIFILHVGNCQKEDDDASSLMISEVLDESTEKEQSKLPLIKRSSVMNSIDSIFNFF